MPVSAHDICAHCDLTRIPRCACANRLQDFEWMLQIFTCATSTSSSQALQRRAHPHTKTTFNFATQFAFVDRLIDNSISAGELAGSSKPPFESAELSAAIV